MELQLEKSSAAEGFQCECRGDRFTKHSQYNVPLVGVIFVRGDRPLRSHPDALALGIFPATVRPVYSMTDVHA
jgi:hypothetical protein